MSMAKKKRAEIKSIIKENLKTKTKDQMYKLVCGVYPQFGVGYRSFCKIYSMVKKQKERVHGGGVDA